MPPKKEKNKKMALADFFADTTSGSWADEMENLPTAPAAREATGPRRGEPGYLDSMPDRSARTFSGAPAPRADVPLPTEPPFTAFIGNMTYETEEGELRDFFAELAPTSVRLVKDPGTGKSKGFGYVEFPSQDALKGALGLSGEQLGGRTIRVNIADSQPTTRREFAPSAADSSSEWRRTGPLPARDPPPSASSRRGSSFTSPNPDQPERDWGAARGAKFVPSAAPAPGFSRETSGGGRGRGEFGGGPRDGPGAREPREPTAADEADQWRSSRPMAPAQPAHGGRDAPPHRAGFQGAPPTSAAPGPADTESTWSRGTKVRQPSGRADDKATPQQASQADERDWRGSRPASSAPSVETSPKMPASRPKLNLLPRSGATDSTTSGSASASKPSPFGAARPVDSASRDAAAAAKIATRDEARRKEDEQRAAAAAASKEEKERKDKERKENVQAQIQQAPKRVHPSRLNGNGEKDAQAPTDSPAPTEAAATSPTPASGPDEDGFEGVSRGARGDRLVQAAAAQKAAAEEKKRKDAKASGFSFAAAAGMMETEGGDEGDEEELASKVEDVHL